MKFERELEFMVLEDLTLDTLVNIKENLGVPGTAKVDVSVLKGDRPWESDVKYMTLSWTEEVE